ncbi:MAG TPA: fumarylacetoacetate hydrolase family protein [Acidobacteriaceae bacterium]|nr:fumarylacetoacetate hydrolase family protein [Acidobacteriaceae bacterium]
MKLLSVVTSKGPRLAAKVPSGILVFSQASGLFPEKSFPFTLQAAISGKGGLKRLLPHLQAVIDHQEVSQFVVPENEVKLTRPFLPNNVICVGLNYKAHAHESNLPLPKQPMLFAKWTNSVIGPGDPIVLPPDTHEVDYEAELAVVIGQKCRGVSADKALDYVAGYTCMNDVSARDFQRGDGQWVRAKSQDTFGPIGPCLVTGDEIPDPQTLGIRCTVNGQVLQDSTTGDMIFGIRELIAFISRGITLQPGDLITTGTPQGVGFARKPPIFLKSGDQVVVEIDGIGSLSNPVKGD